MTADVSEIVEIIRREEGRRAQQRMGLAWTPADGIVVRTEIHLSWRDWFRVLFGRPVHVRTEAWVERTPSRHAVEVHTHVDPLWSSERPRALSTDSPR